ncbi:hypothetical protein [Streptomyces sp. 6N223]|uniref:hypothetical protein n=1 Tax=Streptomyces sp. 6N223 TaxID=3457412 RepID=UPI003FD4A729
MRQWVSQFGCPAAGWLPLVVSSPDGAERAAREIAEWEGEGMREYAEEVYPELKTIWEEMRERRAAPVAVYVPPVPLDSHLRVPIIAYVQGRLVSPQERTMEAIVDLVSQPQPDQFRKPDITVVELPAGPACRMPRECLQVLGVLVQPGSHPEGDGDGRGDGRLPDRAAPQDGGEQRMTEENGEGDMMSEWVPVFDYPADEEWLLLDVNVPGGAERVAQQVADRGGRENKRYAKAVREHLEFSWKGAREEGTAAVVVYVPHAWRNAPLLTPASVNTNRFTPDHGRTMEALMAKMRDPTITPEDAEITAVELPAGPACRVRQTFSLDTGDAGAAVENVLHHVLAEEYPEEILLLNAHWVSDAFSSGMVELADQMAASLRLTARGSGESPRPVLAAPEAKVAFDEVQIGKGMRPIAQHGFVTIEQGVLTLLDSDRQPIDSAPVTKIHASRRGITGGTVVSLTLNGEKYNVSPGWGARRPSLPIPGFGNPVKDATDILMQLIERGGGTTD